jgi:hypothetical protein
VVENVGVNDARVSTRFVLLELVIKAVPTTRDVWPFSSLKEVKDLVGGGPGAVVHIGVPP